MSNFRQWLLSFWSILRRPTPETFSAITKDVGDRFGEGIAWIAGIISFFIVPLMVVFPEPHLLTTLVVSIILIPIWFILYVFLLHRMKGVLFGRPADCYEPLFYAAVSNFAVTSFIFLIALLLSTLLLSPVNGSFLLFIPLLYWLAVSAISVRAIMALGVFQSLGIVLVSFTATTLGFAVISPLLLIFIQDVPRFF